MKLTVHDSKPHDFNECLKQSHAAADLPLWEEIYRQVFPDFLHLVDTRKDGYWQRGGVDRRIIMPGTRQVFVDEKVRGRNRFTGVVYEDIALEFISVDRTNKKGWVCADLMAEYIAYAIAPLGRCFMLPVIPLQEAWKKHGEEWKVRFGVKQAENNGYQTHFVPVPEATLFQAIGAWHRVSFTKIDIWEGAAK